MLISSNVPHFLLTQLFTLLRSVVHSTAELELGNTGLQWKTNEVPVIDYSVMCTWGVAASWCAKVVPACISASTELEFCVVHIELTIKCWTVFPHMCCATLANKSYADASCVSGYVLVQRPPRLARDLQHPLNMHDIEFEKCIISTMPP